MQVQISTSFLKFAAVCCFLSVLTTLGIHVFFPAPPADFDQRLLLFKDSLYILNRWWVIIHCLLVIISMWGVALVLFRSSPGFTGLGFLFFAVFGIAEITRQMYVLFYMNAMREQFLLSSEPVIRESLNAALHTAGLLSSPLYGLFILSFGLGNLFYGISMFDNKIFTKVLSILLITWSVGSFLALSNSFINHAVLGQFLEYYNYTFQPLVRLLLGVFLLKSLPSPGLQLYAK